MFFYFLACLVTYGYSNLPGSCYVACCLKMSLFSVPKLRGFGFLSLAHSLIQADGIWSRGD